jgi:hypothetical protein
MVTKKKVSTRATPMRVKVHSSSCLPGNCAADLKKAAKMLLTAIAQLPNAPTDMAYEITFAEVINAKTKNKIF